MATRTWVGGTSGKWTTAANWSPATVPVDDDDVIVNAGSVSIDDGLDQSAIDLDSMFIGGDYTGEVGNSPTAPLKIGCDSLVIDGGGQNHYIQSGSGKLIDKAEIRGIGTDSDKITGNLYLIADANWTKLAIKKGTVQLHGGAGAFVDVAVEASGGVATNATLEILDGLVTSFYMGHGAGSILSASTAGVVTTLYLGAEAVFTANAGTVTNLVQLTGRFNYWTSTNMTFVKVLSGIFNSSGNETARTIATLDSYVGAVVQLYAGSGAVAVTNNNEFSSVVAPSP